MRTRTEQHELPPAPRAPPRDAEVRPLDVHLAAAQGVPEALDAGSAHLRVLDRVDQPRGQREPLLQVVDAEEAEAVDQGEGEDGLFGEGRGRYCWFGCSLSRGRRGQGFWGCVVCAVVDEFEEDGG